MPTDLEQSIFRTIAYFSLFDYPVTAFEIWKWLLMPSAGYQLVDVRETLTISEWLKTRLETQDGFFVLTGRGDMVATRHERFLDATRKFKRLRRACRYLALLPTIKMLAVCNTLAWMNTKPESDIDLFIVVKPGRIWTARLFTVLPFKLLGLRPMQGAVDPVCFSFFAAADHLDFRPVRLVKDDIYLAAWIRSLVPVVNRGDVERMSDANSWVKRAFPNSFGVTVARPHRFVVRSSRLPAEEGSGLVARSVEHLAKVIQRRRLPAEIKKLANQDTRVIVSDTMLKFHPNDRRGEILEKLETLCVH
ncbi:MAG: hypothetical protein AAB865_03265 [Patescibacteria group bacterium]